ncbi:MAG: hypothetical protein J4G09_08075 [Proteobacteria bacterium]|nr:hypothetical protein [Pseudomonadota bacterium]
MIRSRGFSSAVLATGRIAWSVALAAWLLGGAFVASAGAQQVADSAPAPRPETRDQRRDAVPFSIEDFLPERGGLTWHLHTTYVSLSSDSSEYRLLPLDVEPFGVTLAIPLAVNRREVSDTLRSRLGLSFGLTRRLSVFGGASFAASRSREQLGDRVRTIGFPDGFSSFDAGISYKLTEPTDRVYVTASFRAPLLERVGGEIQGAGSVGVSANAFYILDPLVLFASLAYSHPRERRIDGVRTRHGRVLSLRPGVAFAVNPWMTLDWSVAFANVGRARIDGAREERASRTFARLGLGLSWSLSRPLRMQIASEFGLSGDRDSRLGLSFTYSR